MATPNLIPVTVSYDTVTKSLVVTPETATVFQGDIISWHLQGKLNWPPNILNAITPMPGFSNVLGSLSLVNGNVHATVIYPGPYPYTEDYKATANPSDNPGEILTTHVDDSIDPKIRVNPK
jgi:hypothetical protein